MKGAADTFVGLEIPDLVTACVNDKFLGEQINDYYQSKGANNWVESYIGKVKLRMRFCL